MSSIFLHGSDIDVIEEYMPVMTELEERYCSSLRDAKVYLVTSPNSHLNESSEYFHQDESSPFWTNGEFQPLSQVLASFVH